MCGHSLEKAEIQVRKLTKCVVNVLYVFKKNDSFSMKVPLGEKGCGLFKNNWYFSSCHYSKLWRGEQEERSLLSLHFFLYSGRLQFVRSLLLIQNSFKSQRIYQPLSGGDETADLIRKGFGALQPPQMTSLEIVGAEMLLKFNLHILHVRLVQRPPRKPQDSAETGGVSTELGEFIVSEDSFSFHIRLKEMP